jgi:hypothetical protein
MEREIISLQDQADMEAEFNANVQGVIESAAKTCEDFDMTEARRQITLKILGGTGWKPYHSAAKDRAALMHLAGTFTDFLMALGKQLNAERARQQG